MDAVLRAVALYLILMLIFRLTGKRTLAQATAFDFVILLIVGEATQQALLGEDFSVVHAALVIATLVLLQRGSDFLGARSKTFDNITQGVPTLLIADGQVIRPALRTNLLSEAEILEEARNKLGVERLDDIRWAVLETSGTITVVPKEPPP